jgi:small subunit ribosomal protein S17
MSFERRKVRFGRVVSDKMDKTVVVMVEWQQRHPIYKKAVRRRTRFKAHDEQRQCKLGDYVRIVETRPLSSTKRWRVAEILSRQEIAEIQPEQITVDPSVLKAEVVPPPQPQAQAAAEAPAEGVGEVAGGKAPQREPGQEEREQ